MTEFDPKRHKVWRVELELAHGDWAVAETQEEAIATVVRDAGEHISLRDYITARALPQPKAIGGPDGDDLPWGPIQHQGRQLTINEAIALVYKAEYDTQTDLMPFVDAPPPLRGDPPHPSLKQGQP